MTMLILHGVKTIRLKWNKNKINIKPFRDTGAPGDSFFMGAICVFTRVVEYVPAPEALLEIRQLDFIDRHRRIRNAFVAGKTLIGFGEEK